MPMNFLHMLLKLVLFLYPFWPNIVSGEKESKGCTYQKEYSQIQKPTAIFRGYSSGGYF